MVREQQDMLGLRSSAEPSAASGSHVDMLLFFSLFQWILPNYSMNSSGRCSNWFTSAGEN